MSNHRKVEIRRDDAIFDLLIDENTNEVFVDGAAQFMVGPIVSKISFYSSAGLNENDIEQRMTKLKIAIPTLAFVEFIAQTISNLELASDELLENNERLKEKLIASLNTTIRRNS